MSLSDGVFDYKSSHFLLRGQALTGSGVFYL